jgi:uncharacterized membrane protein YgcG
MKTELISQQIAVFVILLLLSIGCSCSFKTASRGGNASAPSSSVTPEKQSAPSANQSPLPQPTGFVNDFANVFDSESKARLESALTELKQKSDIEFAVVTIETTGGQPIFDYSLAVAKAWGVGPKDTTKGGGILLMLATRDRNWRIQVSRSLEKDLPDDVCKKLGEQSADSYRQGKFADGIIKYVKVIVERLEGLRKFKLNSELTSSQRTTH